MTVEEEVNDLLNKILKNPYSDLNWDLFIKRSKMSELDEDFCDELYYDLHKKYKKNPQRAKRYTDDVFDLYLWMKGRHPNLQEIAEGMGWSLQKARAIVKIAREVGVIRVYSNNSSEYQLVCRYDLTPAIKKYRRGCFITPAGKHKVDCTDVIDLLGNDYSEANQNYVMDQLDDDLVYPSMCSEKFVENWDKIWGIEERDINGMPVTPDTPKKLLKRGSKFL